jgi:hypothetical protein
MYDQMPSLLYLVAVNLVVATIEAGLLIGYFNKETNEDILVYTSFNGKEEKTDISFYVIFSNIVSIFMLTINGIVLFCRHRNKANIRLVDILQLYMFVFLSPFVMANFAFFRNCTHGTPSCFEIHTPLYVTAFLNWLAYLIFLPSFFIVSCCFTKPRQQSTATPQPPPPQETVEQMA